MRSQSKKQQTWTWSDTVAATGETDASLRRKLQRSQVVINSSESGRTEATLWDIAILRVARHLCDLGFEAASAFSLAKGAIEHAYKDLITGRSLFGVQQAKQQAILYLAMTRSAGRVGGPTFISISPDHPEDGRKELLLRVSYPNNVVVPIQSLVTDAWYSLPNRPADVSDWLRAMGQQMDQLLKAQD